MSIFDLEDGDFIFGSGDTGFDSDGHMTVSYTHLDVYKRQTQNSAGLK